MKKILALIIALMFTFAVTAAFAAEAPKAAAPAEKKAATAEKKEAPKAAEKKDDKKAKKATVTGEVIAIDAKANTLTVKGPKKGDVALTANDKTKIMAGKDKKTLADIKAGDKVAVEYTEADNKNTANKIDIKAAPAKKEAPKAEEKKPAAKAEEKKPVASAPAAAPKAEEKKPAAPAKKSAGY
jgi:ribosomal protein S1